MTATTPRPQPYAAVQFEAFRLADGLPDARPLVTATSRKEAVEQGKTRCFHKDTLVIRETGEVGAVLHFYAIRKGRALWIGGERIEPLREDFLFSMNADLDRAPFRVVRPLQHCAGLIAGESERRLSGEGHHCARADHAAASRSSDGSDARNGEIGRHAKTQRLLLLALPARMARLARIIRKADEAAVSRRSTGRLPELRAPVLDGNRLLIDLDDLCCWLTAKADEYHGLGEGHMKFMNAGRVDGYWTTLGTLQQFLRDSDRGGEASETGTGSTEGESAVPDATAHD